MNETEPKRGEIRVIDGKQMRFVEHDDRGQVWEALATPVGVHVPEANAIGAAEIEVGQYVYRRIEKLIGADGGTADGRELDYLADMVANVEEYGARGDEDGPQWKSRHFPAPSEGFVQVLMEACEPIAEVARVHDEDMDGLGLIASDDSVPLSDIDQGFTLGQARALCTALSNLKATPPVTPQVGAGDADARVEGADAVKLAAPVKLNALEREVLTALAKAGTEYCFHFSKLMQETGLDRSAVRRGCRSLGRKGLARYERGLWTEDGDPAGSGYGATDAGLMQAREAQP